MPGRLEGAGEGARIQRVVGDEEPPLLGLMELESVWERVVVEVLRLPADREVESRDLEVEVGVPIVGVCAMAVGVD